MKLAADKAVASLFRMYYIKTSHLGTTITERVHVQKLRVGVVGAGHLGRFHALNYMEMSDVELAGVTDIDAGRGAEVAYEAGCPFINDLASLLAKVDGVSVAVPTDRHHAVGMHVLDAGVHCLMEKPVASTLDEADDLIRRAKEEDLVFHVGQIERFNPALRALEGLTVRPQFIESHRLAPFNPRGTEVAVVLDLMIHDIDAALHLIGHSVTDVNASGAAVISDTVDIANARIRFANGSVANLTASRISQKAMRKLRIFQKDAYISVDFLNKVTDVFRLANSEVTAKNVVSEMGMGEKKQRVVRLSPKIPEKQSLRMELEAFTLAVRGKPSSGVSGEEGRNAMAVAVEILRQIEGESQI